MSASPPYFLAFLTAPLIIAGAWGLLLAGAFQFLSRSFGPRSLWFWPPTLLVLVGAIVCARPGAFANRVETISSIGFPLLISIVLGLLPTWGAYRALRRAPAPRFLGLYLQTAIAVFAGTALIAFATYWGLKLKPVA
jgi:hypothetical protein